MNSLLSKRLVALTGILFVFAFAGVMYAHAGLFSHTICNFTTHTCSTYVGGGADLCSTNADCYTPTPTPTPPPSTLYVDLTGSVDGVTYTKSLSGNAVLADVSLKAMVTGTQTGPITYIFDCGDGTPPITVADTEDNPSTVSSVCNYTAEGTYTATVMVQR